MSEGTNRRRFIKTAMTGALGLGIALSNKSAQCASGEIPKRKLGKTNEMVTMFGLGGWHIGNVKDEKMGIEIIRAALDLGVNFFDSAHIYNEGASEIRYGKGLKGDRHRVFLMSKTMQRTKKGYEMDLTSSLERMQTDYLDIYQFHDVRTEEELKTIFGPDGALEAAEKAKKDGKIRYIGMTGHFNANILAKGLDYWDGFASMQMPINVMDPHYLSNIKIVVPKLVEKNIGIFAMKTNSFGKISANKVATVPECLRFSWSQPISVLISGCDSIQHLNENVQAAKDFTPMTQEEQEKLLARTAPFKGMEIEYYKKKA